MLNVFLLLILFQMKHFIADFPLQTPYMLGKFKAEGWVLPLLAHCSVHSVFTLCIVLYFAPAFWWVALLDFLFHFTMDRIKASPHFLGRFKTLSANEFATASKQSLRYNTFFWWSLGFDQMFHHLTHYLLIWIILS
jgi:hypothetical protein